ncbi:DUF5808 domain-containing protein [Draconibacterium halophilum]|nr:DUF5808 domain-containing protein [Draconibacterium halophilum]
MKPRKELMETMHKDPSNWRGLFYFNRKDPRLTVPKINGLGWTFNFASIYSWLIIVAIILILLGAQFLL